MAKKVLARARQYCKDNNPKYMIYVAKCIKDAANSIQKLREDLDPNDTRDYLASFIVGGQVDGLNNLYLVTPVLIEELEERPEYHYVIETTKEKGYVTSGSGSRFIQPWLDSDDNQSNICKLKKDGTEVDIRNFVAEAISIGKSGDFYTDGILNTISFEDEVYHIHTAFSDDMGKPKHRKDPRTGWRRVDRMPPNTQLLPIMWATDLFEYMPIGMPDEAMPEGTVAL